MRAPHTSLKDHFQEELAALRVEGLGFAAKHPHLAHALGLNARTARDPQVEILMQSFAFLTGRLRQQVEQDRADFPNALLAFLYPHLEAPLPSMLVAELSPRLEGKQENVLARGLYASASTVTHSGQRVSCRFRTCYATPLAPLAVQQLSVEPGHMALRVRLLADPGHSLGTLGPGLRRLRFYLDNSEPGAMHLFEALSLHLAGIELLSAAGDGSQAATMLDPASLRWLGEREEEAVLPSNPHTHPGLRLLQEYFSFPEKFLFFEVSGLDQHDFSAAGAGMELRFLFNAPMAPRPAPGPGALRLNCVPMVNLFHQRIEPLSLDHTQYEYHVMADLENHRHCEIYAIEALESITTAGSRQIAPYFAMDDFLKLERQEHFYVARRQQSANPEVAGSELYLSFLDQQFDLCRPAGEMVGGRALCTNRRLPEQLMSGSPLKLEGPGPVSAIRVLSKPTPHQSPVQIGERPWTLVSQLALNHLSLADTPAALCAFKDLLRLHVGPDAATGQRQIDAIVRMRCRPSMRHVRHEDGWRGFVRGTAVTLDMERQGFADGRSSPVLLCAVLRHFLCLYATVNNLVEVTLETQDIKGVQSPWPPQAGAKPVL